MTVIKPFEGVVYWMMVVSSSARQSSNDIIINNSDNNKSLNLSSSLLNAFLIKKQSVSGEWCRFRLFADNLTKLWEKCKGLRVQ